jgi:uncharacterized radical SAM protein YgiQ
VHELPYARAPHPGYEAEVPAYTMIRDSITINRGCFGGCSFCAIALHEGKAVQSRTLASVLREVAAVRATPGFHGTITDLGGPTANTYGLGCLDPCREAVCRRPSCLTPRRCPFLRTDPGPLLALYRAVREAPGIRHALVASGVRHDLALAAPGYLQELVRHHVGGHLHVAPEHDDPVVLRLARKPPYALFEQFQEQFAAACRAAGVERYLNPYFISGLPGSTDDRMAALVRRLRAEGWRPQQVQAFLPTPGTAATAMFHGGVNPDRLAEPVEMPRALGDRVRQHRLLIEDLPTGGRGRR